MFRPRARQRDLPDGGGGLAVLELERARGQLEHGAAERDGARGDYDDVALLFMQGGDVGRERGQPVAFEAAGGGVYQQRRADLHDDAAEGGEGGRFGHGTGGVNGAGVFSTGMSHPSRPEKLGNLLAPTKPPPNP